MSVSLSLKELETFCVPPAHCTQIIFQEQLFDLVVKWATCTPSKCWYTRVWIQDDSD